MLSLSGGASFVAVVQSANLGVRRQKSATLQNQRLGLWYNVKFMLRFILDLVTAVRGFFLCRTDLALEILALRQQVAVLKRKRPRPKLSRMDRLFWTALRSVWSRWAEVLLIVKPETVVGWHRAGFRLYWRWRSRGKALAELRSPPKSRNSFVAWHKRIQLGALPRYMASF